MSENNDYIQLPPLKKDTPSDVVAFMCADSPDKIIAALLGRYFSFLGTCQGKPLHLAAQDRSVA